jgi:hypothetical protein
VNDPLAMYLADIYTVTANLAGIPGISVPCGENHEKLPIGLQLFARHFDEATLLRVAHAYEGVCHQGQRLSSWQERQAQDTGARHLTVVAVKFFPVYSYRISIPAPHKTLASGFHPPWPSGRGTNPKEVDSNHENDRV